MTPPPPPGQPPAMPPNLPPGNVPGNVPPGYPPRYPACGMPGGMPPQMMPPMMMMPPPPRQGGFARAILLTLATTIFGLSLMLNVYLLLFSGVLNASQASESRAIETPIPSIAPGDPTQKVAVVRFSGEISDATKRPFVMLLEHLRLDANVKAIVLEIDSPGGEVTASDELYDAILRLKKEKGVPLVVSMGAYAASGGYYMAMASDKILAQETTITGSIGVIRQAFDLTGFAEKYGVRGSYIVADGAPYKDAGSPWRPITPDELAYIKSGLNDAFAVFKDRVEKGRPGMTRGEIDAAANGKIYTAKQALQLKLIDRVGYLEDAIADAASLAGLTKPSAIRVERQLTFTEQLFGSAGVTAAKAVSLPAGVNVDAELVDRLTRSRLLYKWDGH